MATAVYKLLVDWDGDGSLESDTIARGLGSTAAQSEVLEDVTAFMLARAATGWEYGRDYPS